MKELFSWETLLNQKQCQCYVHGGSCVQAECKDQQDDKKNGLQIPENVLEQSASWFFWPLGGWLSGYGP